MISAPPNIPALVSAGLAIAGVAQAAVGLAAARGFARRTRPSAARPAITVLKPLHGDEPFLEAALTGFFTQDYPAVQLVFGVQHANDPAVAVVARLQRRFPHVASELMVDGTPHGANHKIANLINMYPSVRHDVLVVSDSDMHVAPDYLARVADALAVPGTGLVTSIYTGLPAGRGISAQLGCAYIAQIFASGVLMARLLGRRDCMGATMAFTRETLMRIGGFPALSAYVADDAVLGMRVRALGRTVSLAATVPATTVADSSFAGLFRHELRWARTIRAVEPLGFAVSAIQFPVFWAALAAVLASFSPAALVLLAITTVIRAACGRAVERVLGAHATPLWLAPLRDLLSVVVMAVSFLDREVSWRGQVLSTAPDRALVRYESAVSGRADHGLLASAPSSLVAGEG